MSGSKPDSAEKTTPNAGYAAIVALIISGMDDFLSYFQVTISAEAGKSSVSDEFLTKFAADADRFASSYCKDLAAMLRENSTQADVRETTEPILTRLIRNRCFETLDSIAIGFLSFAQQSGVDLKSVMGQLSDSRIRDSVMTGPNGQMMVSEELVPKATSANPKVEALFHVVHFIEALGELPQTLLDYGATKLLGSAAEFSTEIGYVMNIKDAIDEKRRLCLTLLESFEAVKQKKWEDQRAADTAAIKGAALNSLMSTGKRKSGFGWLFVGLLFSSWVWIASQLSITHIYIIISAVVSGILGIVFLYMGISNLIKG